MTKNFLLRVDLMFFVNYEPIKRPKLVQQGAKKVEVISCGTCLSFEIKDSQNINNMASRR